MMIDKQPFDFGGESVQASAKPAAEPVDPFRTDDKADHAPAAAGAAKALERRSVNTASLDEAMGNGGSAELPFSAAYFWPLNGDGRMKTAVESGSMPPATYFGGWSVAKDNLQELADSLGKAVPTMFGKPYESQGRDKSFFNYSLRSLICAPIGMRQSWITDKMRTPNYVDGSRRHVQQIVMLGVPGANGIEAFGPAILSAKGYQAGNMLNAFTNWKRASTPARKQGFDGCSPWLFWVQVGTFGERQQHMVGPVGRQSPITPIGGNLPKTLTVGNLKQLYVGDAVAEEMVRLVDDCRDWLSAWNETSSTQPAGEATDAPADVSHGSAPAAPAASFSMDKFLNEGN